MSTFELLIAAVLGGSTLGATIAGFLAYRRGAREKVLTALVDDQDKRIKQLEGDRDRLAKQVENLEREKRLPLDQLSQLIVTQHTAQMKSMTDIANSMAEIARAIAPTGGSK